MFVIEPHRYENVQELEDENIAAESSIFFVSVLTYRTQDECAQFET
jgi:hypothetical protein